MTHFYAYQDWIPELTIRRKKDLEKFKFYGGKWEDFFWLLDPAKVSGGSILAWSSTQVPQPAVDTNNFRGD